MLQNKNCSILDILLFLLNFLDIECNDVLILLRYIYFVLWLNALIFNKGEGSNTRLYLFWMI